MMKFFVNLLLEVFPSLFSLSALSNPLPNFICSSIFLYSEFLSGYSMCDFETSSQYFFVFPTLSLEAINQVGRGMIDVIIFSDILNELAVCPVWSISQCHDNSSALFHLWQSGRQQVGGVSRSAPG